MNSRTIQIIVAVVVLVSLTGGGLWPAAAQQPQDLPAVPNPTVTPPAPSSPGSSSEFKAGEVLVKLKGHLPLAAAIKMLEQYEASRIRVLGDSGVEVWQVPNGRELATAEQLSADSRVEYAEPNYRYRAFIVPNDPSWNKQWAHTLIRSSEAWNITTGSASVLIAILDSGIDENHPDLQAKIVAGFDVVDGDSNPHDQHGHGSHVAGIAAAVTNNGIGVAGMDWAARIMPVRVLDAEGAGYASDIAEGINWAYRNGARVLNLSLGGSSDSQTLHDAVKAANSAGCLVIAAMGNCRTFDPLDCPVVNPTMYPAAYSQVLAVAATGPTDSYASYSQYGLHCDVAAPGGDMSGYHDSAGIYSTMPTYPVHMTTAYGYYTDYDYANGTSQAAPYVAGLAALVWAVNPALTSTEVQDIIKATADDLGAPGWDEDYGYGRINAQAALQAISAPQAPTLLPIENSDGDGTYLVDWNDVPNASNYALQEDGRADFSSATIRYTGAESQFMITDQGPGNWYYRVRASSNIGDSPWSNVQSVSVTPEAPVLNPIDNADNDEAYRISWSESAGAIGYRLEEADNPSFTDPQIRYAGASLSYDVTGQPEGTWYYRVQAYNSAGNGPWSNSQSATVGPAALSSPKLLDIENDDGDGSYVVDWTEVSGATSYILEESREPYFYQPSKLYEGAATQFSVVDQPGGTWYYRVRASGPAGQSGWSNEQAVTVTARIYVPWMGRNYGTGEPDGGVENGDFEAGRTVWTEYSSRPFGLPIIRATPDFPSYVRPHSGSWAAWLGGVDDEDSYIEQQVTVPNGRRYLVYWHWIDSEDICFTTRFDYATVEVDGSEVDYYDLCGSRNTGGWVRHVVDLGAFAGRSVSLRIRVQTDQSFNSNLFVDDVTLLASPVSGSGQADAFELVHSSSGGGESTPARAEPKSDTN